MDDKIFALFFLWLFNDIHLISNSEFLDDPFYYSSIWRGVEKTIFIPINFGLKFAMNIFPNL